MAFGRKKLPSTQDQDTLDAEVATVWAILGRYPDGTELHFGSPTRCPDCGEFGMIERTDLAQGFCLNHCRRCGRDWVVTARALRAVRNAPIAPRPEGDGRGAGSLWPVSPSRPTAPVAAEPESPAQEEPEPEPMPVWARAQDRPRPAPAGTPEVEPVAEEPVPVWAKPKRPTSPPAVRSPSPAPLAAELLAAELLAAEPLAVEPPLPAVGKPVTTVAEAAVTLDLSTPAPPLRVLVVEDNPFDLTVIEDLLEPFLAAAEVELTHFATRAQAEEATRTAAFDVVLLDLELPDSSGLTTVMEWNHHVTAPLPLIAVVDSADPGLIREARALGVATVIQRPHLEKLATQADTGRSRLLKLLKSTAAATPASRGHVSDARA